MPAFNYKPQPYSGPSVEEVIALRKTYLSPCEALLMFAALSRPARCSVTNCVLSAARSAVLAL